MLNISQNSLLQSSRGQKVTMKSSRLFLLALTALAVACASSGTGGGGTARNRDVITRAQIDSASVQDIYAVVQRYRPEYLRDRGGGTMQTANVLPVVYVDGSRRGGPETLRSLRTYDVEEVRFLSGADATTRYGTDHLAGAIEVKTRQGIRR
jgi:hypothetical protein